MKQDFFNKILFIDIETVPLYYHYNDLDETGKNLWDKKSQYIQKRDQITSEEAYEKAGIYAEFSKVICIGIGFIHFEGDDRELRVKVFNSEVESELLLDFSKLLLKHNHRNILCAHNGKEFDFPFLARRMMIHGIKLPEQLNLSGKKPWENPHIDTMELWRFGDFKHFTSLELLTHVFNIPSPKNDIDGSQVAYVYYEENDLERISQYCKNDVIATTQVFLKLKGGNIFTNNQITYIP